MRLGGDRVVDAGGDRLDIDGVHLVAAGGTRLFLDEPLDADGGLLGEGLGALEDVLGNGRLLDDALALAGAVADDQEGDLARGAAVVQPAGDGNLLAHMLRQMVDGCCSAHARVIGGRRGQGQFSGCHPLVQDSHGHPNLRFILHLYAATETVGIIGSPRRATWLRRASLVCCVHLRKVRARMCESSHESLIPDKTRGVPRARQLISLGRQGTYESTARSFHLARCLPSSMGRPCGHLRASLESDYVIDTGTGEHDLAARPPGRARREGHVRPARDRDRLLQPFAGGL